MPDQASNNNPLLAPLVDLLNSKLPTDSVAAVTSFAYQYYQSTTKEEISERSLDNLYGATLSCWQFLQNFDAKQPKIHVYNPDLEQHGWRAQHTVIEILQSDMPFMVDSVRIELNRRGLVIHTILNEVMLTRRDDGKLLKLCDASDKDASAEALIYL
ncbi:hypothetical protein, partial [Neptunomonas sp.]